MLPVQIVFPMSQAQEPKPRPRSRAGPRNAKDQQFRATVRLCRARVPFIRDANFEFKANRLASLSYPCRKASQSVAGGSREPSEDESAAEEAWESRKKHGEA